MKKILLGSCLLACLFSYSQTKEGKFVFERTIQMPVRNLNIDPEIAKQLPKSRTDQFELLFNSNHSLWQFLPNASADENAGTFSSPGGGQVIMRVGGGANEISYHNLEKGTRVDQREVMQRSFIVADTIAKLSWKLTDETKTLLNYTVRKATAQRIGTRPIVSMENGEMKREIVADTSAIVAWFTTEIPVSTGPEFQGQLPGLILELDVNNGRTIYKAIEFSPKVNVAKIKEPKEGKKVTAAEYTIERDKILEQMTKNMPSGNVIRMN